MTSSLCACGCGGTTSQIKVNNSFCGHVKGQFRRFIKGHQSRTPKPTLSQMKERTVEAANGCWEWVAAKAAQRYAFLQHEGKNILGHRYVYELTHGSIPDGMVVRHKCDNKCCINPEHLELGTNADNMRDKAERGRATRGETHHKAKLSEVEVVSILTSGYSNVEEAQRHGVSEAVISNIRRRRIWKHVKFESTNQGATA